PYCPPFMPAVTISPSLIHGLGVCAARGFASGESILVINDSRQVNPDHPLRPELGETESHCDQIAAGVVVLLQSPERYLNHSCQPNAYVKTLRGRRHVISLIPIQAGDEITLDYSLNRHGQESWPCQCGSPECRGQVPGSFFDLPHTQQLRSLALLESWFCHEHPERIAALRQENGHNLRI
ncbi:MAG: SET domain-containing protein-lysine N-methyltransferase, partial [Anaerolineales bacterium]|nr:SET domain-containing protein-lysine N-methyltransferase [Anaerolineales bacterium]